MIDFINWTIDSGLDRLLQNPVLSFEFGLKSKSGEQVVKNGYITQRAEYRSIRFTHIRNIETNREFIDIEGSLHKYWQEGTNYQDFDSDSIGEAVYSFCNTFNLSPNEGRIHRIEFGVNVQPLIRVNTILKSLVCFGFHPFEFRGYNGTGSFYIYRASQYSVKIYNKGKQYNRMEQILRFEVRADKMQFLQTKGIEVNALRDALRPETLIKVGELLVKMFDQILWQDSRIDANKIKPNRERIAFEEGRNPQFWEGYKKTHTAKGYKLKRERFKEILKKYQPNSIQEHIRDLISTKWNQLNTTPILPSFKTETLPQFYPNIVGKSYPEFKRYCLTCGRDISHQRKGSQFCSEKDFGREVKRCRNKISNRKQKELRLYPGPLLFDIGLHHRSQSS